MTTNPESFELLSFEDTEWKLLFQGAESRVYEGQYKNQPAILKQRFKKLYRLPELDQKLTKKRIKSEIKAYQRISDKCKDISINMSSILYSDDRNIIFSKIENAFNLSEYIVECQQLIDANDDGKQKNLIEEILKKLAQLIAQLHSIGIVHGDLTTSNFLVKKDGPSTSTTPLIIPIDFGLSYSSTSDEDFAVDLYVLERAIQSTHPALDFNIFLKTYQDKMATDKINKKLDQVRMRGRKRLMIG